LKALTKFPKRLRAIREMRGLSVRVAARIIGISPSTLQRWESGISSPSLEKITRSAERLNCTITELIGAEP